MPRTRSTRRQAAVPGLEQEAPMDATDPVLEPKTPSASVKKKKTLKKEVANNEIVESLEKALASASIGQTLEEFREEQFDILNNIIRPMKDGPSRTSFIHVVGPKSSGKATTVRDVIAKLKFKNAFIDCRDCCGSVKILLSEILCALKPKKRINVDNLNDFVIELREILDENEPVVIVLQRAERLRRNCGNVLAALTQLSRLTPINSCIITISRIPFHNFQHFLSGTSYIPLQITFPAYAKDDLRQLLCILMPRDTKYSQHLHQNYCKALVDTFFIFTTDVQELLYLAEENWPKYVEPIENEKLDESDAYQLWKLIKPEFKASFKRVFLRNQISPEEFIERLELDLPFYAKFMLISAYIASYNPAATDKRFFVKNECARQGKHRRHWTLEGSTKERDSAHLLGPKIFPLERWLRIFLVIVEAKEELANLNLFSQISTLVNTGFVAQISAAGNLDVPKFRCLIDLDTVSRISKSVDFDIRSYLVDFLR